MLILKNHCQNRNVRRLSRIIFLMNLLVILFSPVLSTLMKGLNLIMNLLNYLLNLPGSDLATLLLLAFLMTLILTLAVFLVTFVRSWIQGKQSKNNSQLFLQSLGSCSGTILTFLNDLFRKEQPTQSSPDISHSSPSPESPEQSLSLLQILEKAVDFLKEDNNHEKH